MKTAQDILLRLVRTALWGPEGNELTSVPEWDKVLFLAKKQTLTGLVAEAVPHLPEEFRPDPQTGMKLYASAVTISRSHSLLDRKVADLKTRLEAQGIHTVLFKGQGVARNYPNPLSRQCGDIDMYVGLDNFARVLDMLKPDDGETADKYRSLKHFNLEEDGVDIEIHRIAEHLPGIKRDRKYQEWTIRHLNGEDIFRTEIGGTIVNLPPHQFNAVYIMNHAWHHFLNGGIGLRQLCDWTMFLHRFHKKIDLDVLRTDLEQFGLVRAWHILAGIAVKHLGLPADECPLYCGKADDKADAALEVIWREGNFGHHSEDRKTPRPAGHFAGKLHSFRTNSGRIRRIFAISPADITLSWISYFITGMRNVFVRLK